MTGEYITQWTAGSCSRLPIHYLRYFSLRISAYLCVLCGKQARHELNRRGHRDTQRSAKQ